MQCQARVWNYETLMHIAFACTTCIRMQKELPPACQGSRMRDNIQHNPIGETSGTVDCAPGQGLPYQTEPYDTKTCAFTSWSEAEQHSPSVPVGCRPASALDRCRSGCLDNEGEVPRCGVSNLSTYVRPQHWDAMSYTIRKIAQFIFFSRVFLSSTQ